MGPGGRLIGGLKGIKFGGQAIPQRRGLIGSWDSFRGRAGGVFRRTPGGAARLSAKACPFGFCPFGDEG